MEIASAAAVMQHVTSSWRGVSCCPVPEGGVAGEVGFEGEPREKRNWRPMNIRRRQCSSLMWAVDRSTGVWASFFGMVN